MKRILLLLALLATVSCVKEGLDNAGPDSDTFTLSLTASAPESSVDTKTQISDDLSVVWNSDDQIKVCFPVNFDLYNNSGKDISGVSGIFTLSSEDMSSSAVFSCDTWTVNMNEEVNTKRKYNSVGYAFYPSSVNFSHSVGNYSNGDRGTLSASYTIPSEQNAVEGSFDKNLNPAYAVVDLDETLAGTADAEFQNLAALVRINLGEEIDNVKEIRINTANSSASTVCGTLNLTISNDNDRPGITTGLQTTTSDTPIILKKEDGQNLQAGQTYYAVIAPGRTHVGLKLTFVSEDGALLEKTVTFAENWAVKASDCWTINVKTPIEYPDPTVLEVEETSFELSYASMSQEVEVEANYEWKAALSSPQSWIRVKDGNGSGQGSFTIEIDENTDLSSRSAEITVTSKEKKEVITVTQDCKRYYVKKTVSQASDLEYGKTYAIGFQQADGYYWKTGSDGKVSRNYYDAAAGFTADYIYKYEPYSVEGESTGNGWSLGVLKSEYNSLYLDYYDNSFSNPENGATNGFPEVMWLFDGDGFMYMDALWEGYICYSDYDGLYRTSDTSVYDYYAWILYEVE